MSTYFQEKVVIITGSSMGIGKSLALLLGKQHAKVVLNGRNQQKLLETETELKNLGYEIFSIAGDVTLEEDCKRLIHRFGRIDILVNNAGAGMRGKIADLSPETISTIYKVNAIAPIVLSQMALPHIIETKGSIVFTSSLAGLRGLPLLSVYSAAKMSLTAFAQALRAEQAISKIHVGLVYVGITQLEIGKTAIGPDGKPVPLAARKGLLVKTIDEVASKIARNISSRKKQTVIGLPGKIFFLLVRYLPRLFEFVLLRSQKKINKLYK